MLQYDRQISISIGGSRKAKVWMAQTLYWSELADRFKTPVRSSETLAEYLKCPKARQDELKDVGGFVGGALLGNRRKAGSVIGRDILTLDFDNIPMGQTADILRRIDALGCAYVVYSTRKHEEVKPRLRLVVPTDRTLTADEYQPIARKLAERVGIELCDPTTFEESRLMYWPSCCSDSVYVCTLGDKPFLCADEVLALYVNWRDYLEWPEVPGTQKAREKLVEKQGDPAVKPGIVGAFCRVYDVHSAINSFLLDVYAPYQNDRYTFLNGSTAGGGVVYEGGKFLYSHHATDPAGGKLCNAFDLVRLHQYSALDEEAKPDTPANKLPSYAAMCEFAVSNNQVAQALSADRYQAAIESFKGVANQQNSGSEDENCSWLSLLKLSSETGAAAKTTDNIIKIMENDPLLKGKLAFDEFANRGLVLGALPWNQIDKRRDWMDLDDAGLRHYFEHAYGITGATKLTDGAALVAHKNKFNDVVEYLEALEWDGCLRLDTLIIDYLGAEDNIYTRAVARKSFTAAVARVMDSGCKYDTMPVFVGDQGMGKSTFLQKLAGRWFSDGLTTFEGKEACELIQGTWINEIGELAGYSRSEKNAVKLFLSRTEDIFREPYGRRTARYPRRCVFFGTTNEREFLRDNTGERRFWPVDVGVISPTKNIFVDLDGEVCQIWAEALFRWRSGEPLYMSVEVERHAKRAQESHKESSAKEGIIADFVAKKVPIDWPHKSVHERRLYWSGEIIQNAETPLVERDRICAAEVWCECLSGDIKHMKRADTIEINGILGNIEGFKRSGFPIKCGSYGNQRAFIKAN